MHGYLVRYHLKRIPYFLIKSKEGGVYNFINYEINMINNKGIWLKNKITWQDVVLPNKEIKSINVYLNYKDK